MKSLIVEDDFTSRLLLQELLKDFGPAHIAVNGKEAVKAIEEAHKNGDAPYQLICMDIMMPEMDGQTALKQIRDFEVLHGIMSTDGATIIMTTALNDMKNVSNAYQSLCDGYLVKPISKKQLHQQLQKLELI
jgi:two-component system chemotaxis response regulator CheY